MAKSSLSISDSLMATQFTTIQAHHRDGFSGECAEPCVLARIGFAEDGSHGIAGCDALHTLQQALNAGSPKTRQLRRRESAS
ncbi:MAG: hypothetical protein M3M98_06535 [Nitrospirota bacterium]|nr:hypothetical protein [Nitrospirota bacterium]